MLSERSSPTILLPLLHDSLIPWAQDSRRIVVAQKEMRRPHMPPSVRLEKRKLHGKRVAGRSDRMYGNSKMEIARWSNDGMIEIESPKLLCVLNGRADLWVSKYVLTCGPGTFLLVPTRMPHPDGAEPHLSQEHRATGACDLLQIIVFQRSVHCWICRSEGEHHRPINPLENYLVRHEQAADLFRLFSTEAATTRENSQSISHHLLQAFFMLLEREIKAGRYLHTGPSVEDGILPVRSADFLNRVERYLSSHLSEHLIMQDVAREMHLSRAQFARRFRQESGKTFTEYLTSLRMQEAQILLTQSEWTAAAIANFVGFKSPTYFHRLFVRTNGVTPGEFRRQSQKS